MMMETGCRSTNGDGTAVEYEGKANLNGMKGFPMAWATRRFLRVAFFLKYAQELLFLKTYSLGPEDRCCHCVGRRDFVTVKAASGGGGAGTMRARVRRMNTALLLTRFPNRFAESQEKYLASSVVKIKRCFVVGHIRKESSKHLRTLSEHPWRKGGLEMLLSCVAYGHFFMPVLVIVWKISAWPVWNNRCSRSCSVHTFLFLDLVSAPAEYKN